MARRAGVSQTRVSELERGNITRLSHDAVTRIAAVVEVLITLEARWRGSDGERLLDRRHAELVERVVRELQYAGFETVVEYTFNHFGERGAADIVGWHAPSRSLLIVEVKTRLVDLQETLSTLGRKVRIIPKLVVADRGWQPTSVSYILAVPDLSSLRRVVDRHRSVFDSAFPQRSLQVRGWLRSPAGQSLRGAWFLSDSGVAAGRRRSTAADGQRRPDRPPLSGHTDHRHEPPVA